MHALRSKTAEEAVGRWPGILQRLGIDPSYLRNTHGPCPICGGEDRYRFDDKNGRGTWYCSRCGAGDAFQLLEALLGWSFGKVAKEVDRIVGTVPAGPITPTRTEESKMRVLQRVWAESREVIHGDPVWLYLNRRLGVEQVPAGLRMHPRLKYTDENGRDLGRFPAMVAKIQYPDGTGASIHRTYLTDGGEKASVPQPKKIMAGKALKSGAVRLSGVEHTLGISEGIETALAASIRFRVPVWAATNAALLESWMPPVGVAKVMIFGDNDKSYTGQASAYELARRLVQNGLAVEVHVPDRVGKDWADFAF